MLLLALVSGYALAFTPGPVESSGTTNRLFLSAGTPIKLGEPCPASAQVPVFVMSWCDEQRDQLDALQAENASLRTRETAWDVALAFGIVIFFVVGVLSLSNIDKMLAAWRRAEAKMPRAVKFVASEIAMSFVSMLATLLAFKFIGLFDTEYAAAHVGGAMSWMAFLGPIVLAGYFIARPLGDDIRRGH